MLLDPRSEAREGLSGRCPSPRDANSVIKAAIENALHRLSALSSSPEADALRALAGEYLGMRTPGPVPSQPPRRRSGS